MLVEFPPGVGSPKLYSYIVSSSEARVDMPAEGRSAEVWDLPVPNVQNVN